jgi:hypothetical protein
MEYSVEFDINTFEFWGGARQVMKLVREEDLLEDAETLIETAFEGETPTKTQINDYVWFYLEDDLREIYDKALWPEAYPESYQKSKSSED